MTKRKAKTSEIDWSAPIELDDGTPVLLLEGPNRHNHYLVEIPPDATYRRGDPPYGFRDSWWYEADGTWNSGDRNAYYFIRNRSTAPSETPSVGITATLAERGSRYGSFADNARFAQRLKALISSAPSWPHMTDYQREGIEMILFKMSRALTGDPAYRDNWHDMVGYAKLVDDLMAAEEAAAV
ncbi:MULTISPECIES: DUF6378 domain-containing protein [unclassified Sphingomonas]|uniref:DUF6378 domain-containing protein n=1 Tax=unclassified Sphingomonas TaxID=196159 RepID=UPI0021518AD8|nr:MULTISPECIES: DUF6378 domain-containing protein [unclassified Sphingomonas]MCR5870693.1 DUF6378 domain-containing protein [Sphingomonas sp. J344]UUY00971.1 DUF6378 domain-containing protein [Sphingomonas sp. J315]